MAIERNTAPQTQQLRIDLYYFWRCLMRSLYVIILCSILAGIGTYMFMSLTERESYSSDIRLAVINQGGSSNNFSEKNVEIAVKRNVSVLNSESLKTQMDKKVPGLKGSIRASRVGDTNLILLTAKSSTPHGVISLLKTAMDTYPELSSYFGSGYFLKKMDTISASKVVRTGGTPMKNAALAVLAVLAAGGGITILYAMYSDHIHDNTQAEQILDLKILGNLCFTKKKKDQKGILIHRKNIDISYYEEMDRLAAAVQKKLDQNQYKTLMVSSIYENEGKTTVSANIALSLAKRGKRVVLVEGDLRRPAVAKIFDFPMEGKKELSDFLNNEAELRDVMIKNQSAYGLYQILQGKAAGNAERLLANEKFQKMLEMLAKVADYIIIDTPPVGAVQDAELIASMASAALLVVRQDIVRAPEINDVVDVFEEAGTTMIGGVLNMVRGEKTSTMGRGKYGRYYYRYGYETNKQ